MSSRLTDSAGPPLSTRGALFVELTFASCRARPTAAATAATVATTATVATAATVATTAMSVTVGTVENHV